MGRQYKEFVVPQLTISISGICDVVDGEATVTEVKYAQHLSSYLAR